MGDECIHLLSSMNGMVVEIDDDLYSFEFCLEDDSWACYLASIE